MNVNINDYYLLCRICLQNAQQIKDNNHDVLDAAAEEVNNLSILNICNIDNVDLQIIKMVQICASKEISDNQELPQQICLKCFSKLTESYRLVMQIRQSEEFLQNLLESTPITIIDNQSDSLLTDITSKESQIQTMPKNHLQEITSTIKNKIHNELVEVHVMLDTKNVDATNNVLSKCYNIEITEINAITSAAKDSVTNVQSVDSSKNIIKINYCNKCNLLFLSAMELQTHREKCSFSDKIVEFMEEDKAENCNNEIGPLTETIYQQMVPGSTGIELINASSPDEKFVEAASPSKSCLICTKIFPNVELLHKHLENIHSVRSDHSIAQQYQCNECDKAYTSMANLTLHQQKHSGFIPYKCKICNRGFNNKNALTSHMATHTGRKEHLCNMCDRTFTSANILRQHKMKHSNARGHKCTVCTKAFFTSNDLRVHFRSHTGERPFLCSVCGRGFSRVTHLNIHFRTHSGERPYVCQTCTKGFSQSNDLKAHIRTHTGEKPYACKICNKKFNQSSGLKSHIKSHTNERNYLCDVCHKSFTQASSLTRHMKLHS